MTTTRIEPALPAPALRLLESNLCALRRRQPEVAAEIGRTDMPAGLRSATGRDGTPTCIVSDEQGAQWFGGCSMPRAAAEEIFCNVDPRGGSVTLPAMLTGMEAIVLAERLAPRFAVFVLDRAANFRAALALRDYEFLLEAGRVVLLLLDDLVARTRQFFSHNPGYAVPATMLKVPQLRAGELANLTRGLEAAAGAALEVQNRCTLDRVARLQSKSPSPISIASRVGVLDLDDSAEMHEPAARLRDGLETSGIPYSALMTLRPEQCHVAARLEQIRSCGAEWIIYLNGVSNRERSLLPANMPVVRWPGAACRVQPGDSLGPFDALVVSSQADFTQARSDGWPDGQIIRLEPCAGRTVPDGELGDTSPTSPVNLIMNLPDDRPEAAGVNLPSQIALWQALQQEVVRRGDHYRPEDASQILGVAQESSGTRLTDSSLLEMFETFLRVRIAPAVVARGVARTLIRNGLKPQVWGRNWPEVGRSEDLRRGPYPGGSQLSSFFEKAAWTVIPWFSHDGVQCAMDAMARGLVVLMRGDAEHWIAQYPDLRELAHGIQWFGGRCDAATALREAQARHEALAESARLLSRQIQSRHRMHHRVQTLIDFVRTRQIEHTARSAHVERL